MPRAFPPDGYFRARMCASFIVALSAALVVPAAALVVPPATRPPFGDPLGLRRAAPAALPLRGVAAAALPLFGGAAVAHADAFSGIDGSLDLSNPRNFQPVCPASDGFYRFGKDLVVGLVGPESVKEYAPLIAGGLLRVRLELCVVESFVYEAIVPFVRQNGLSWVLPLHETVETFLAGVVFAVASNFILIGSTKIVTVIFTYGDVFFGFPLRVVGGAGWRTLEDRAQVTLTLTQTLTLTLTLTLTFTLTLTLTRTLTLTLTVRSRRPSSRPSRPRLGL